MKSFASLLARHRQRQRHRHRHALPASASAACTSTSTSASASVATSMSNCGSACPATCTIRMTVDAASVTTLRQLAMRVCGAALEFMRIAVCTGGARMQVWLCVQLPFAATLNEAIARHLPGVRFDDCKTVKIAGAAA